MILSHRVCVRNSCLVHPCCLQYLAWVPCHFAPNCSKMWLCCECLNPWWFPGNPPCIVDVYISVVDFLSKPLSPCHLGGDRRWQRSQQRQVSKVGAWKKSMGIWVRRGKSCINIYLVGGLEHPNWLIFFRGFQTTNQYILRCFKEWEQENHVSCHVAVGTHRSHRFCLAQVHPPMLAKAERSERAPSSSSTPRVCHKQRGNEWFESLEGLVAF